MDCTRHLQEMRNGPDLYRKDGMYYISCIQKDELCFDLKRKSDCIRHWQEGQTVTGIWKKERLYYIIPEGRIVIDICKKEKM